MIKKYTDELFVCLDWILKKNPKDLPEITPPSTFIINRWLSMADPLMAQVVNVTANRWIYKTNLSKENTLINKFYRTVLPKKNSRIFYIKKEKSSNKNNQELDLEEKNYCHNLELSLREINLYNQTLEELKN
jgi:hypothetical protein